MDQSVWLGRNVLLLLPAHFTNTDLEVAEDPLEDLLVLSEVAVEEHRDAVGELDEGGEGADPVALLDPLPRALDEVHVLPVEVGVDAIQVSHGVPVLHVTLPVDSVQGDTSG